MYFVLFLFVGLFFGQQTAKLKYVTPRTKLNKKKGPDHCEVKISFVFFISPYKGKLLILTVIRQYQANFI